MWTRRGHPQMEKCQCALLLGHEQEAICGSIELSTDESTDELSLHLQASAAHHIRHNADTTKWLLRSCMTPWACTARTAMAKRQLI